MQQLKGSIHQGKTQGKGLYPRKIKHSLFQVLSAETVISVSYDQARTRH